MIISVNKRVSKVTRISSLLRQISSECEENYPSWLSQRRGKRDTVFLGKSRSLWHLLTMISNIDISPNTLTSHNRVSRSALIHQIHKRRRKYDDANLRQIVSPSVANEDPHFSNACNCLARINLKTSLSNTRIFYQTVGTPNQLAFSIWTRNFLIQFLRQLVQNVGCPNMWRNKTYLWRHRTCLWRHRSCQTVWRHRMSHTPGNVRIIRVK